MQMAVRLLEVCQGEGLEGLAEERRLHKENAGG